MLATANYGLRKPEGTDVVNIDDFNGNADIIDTKIKEINTALPLKAPLDSPALTGAPTAPTQTATDNSTKIANTAFVTIAVANKTSVTGNAGTATKLATARTLALTGDVTGSASFDGSGDATITAVVGDDSHAHTIGYVSGLQAYLDSHTTKISQLSNPNILINGDFQVWQRGTAFSKGSEFYTADRWLSYYSTITKIGGGIRIAGDISTAGLKHKTEFMPVWAGKTFTISFKAMNFTGSYALFYSDGVVTNSQLLSFSANGVYSATFTVSASATKLEFYFQATTTTTSLDLEYVKLELGSLATINFPRNYEEDLALCRRYYEIVTFRGVYPGTTTNNMYSFSYNVFKRITPTITVTGANISGTACNLAVATSQTDKDMVVMQSTTSAGASGTYYWMSALLYIDAEIY